jgi:hypothetical protein
MMTAATGVRLVGGLCIVVCGTAMFLSPAYTATETYPESVRPYYEALGKVCPNKHLEHLYPGQLDFLIEQFKESLSFSARNSFESWAQTKCIGNGISCDVEGALRAAVYLNMSQRLAEKVCASDLVCRSDVDCGETNPPK